MHIEQKMEILKEQLNHMVINKSLYTDKEILTISQELDKLVNLWYLEKMEQKKA